MYGSIKNPFVDLLLAVTIFSTKSFRDDVDTIHLSYSDILRLVIHGGLSVVLLSLIKSHSRNIEGRPLDFHSHSWHKE